MNDWNDVVEYALSLPGAQLSTSYGAPAVKMDGRAFVTRSREEDSFHVRASHDDKTVLIEIDPATFWQTPHYEDWPGLLVRFGSTDPVRVRLVIARAQWDRAKPRSREELGDRP